MRGAPGDLIRERTGLVPDPYFSATKLEWLLEQTGAAGDLAFGTVDSWLVWRLTGEHVTDVSNASRTLLVNLETLDWDDELLALFGVPRSVLPRIVSSSGVLAHGATLRRRRAGDRNRRRPAGGALRAGVLHARPREGDLWHRQLRARERGDGAAGAGGRRARDGRVAARRRGSRLRARGIGVRRRCGGAVAARRARGRRGRSRDRGDGPFAWRETTASTSSRR